MLTLSKLTTLYWRLSLLALIIGPAVVKAQSVTVLAEAGCSSFFYWDGMSGKYQYQWVCDDRPAIALPESYLNDQFNYYLDVLSGFPVDTKSKKTRPQYRQTYQWMAKDLVTVGRDSCLYANMKLPAGYYVKHILGDQVGVCPPSNYDLSEKELFPNPYYMREEARKAANSQTTTTSDFVADNAAGVPNPNIPEDPVINTPVEFSAEGSLLPHTADKVAYGTMDFFSGDT